MQEKFMTAALVLSEILIIFFEIYKIKNERYSSGNNELKLLCKISKLNLRYIPYKALR